MNPAPRVLPLRRRRNRQHRWRRGHGAAHALLYCAHSSKPRHLLLADTGPLLSVEWSNA